MPRNQGTSRKGKPKRQDRIAGMGKALQNAQQVKKRYVPKLNGAASRGSGGMTMIPGVESVGMEDGGERNADMEKHAKSVLEMEDLDDFLFQADLANREFLTERESSVALDSTGQLLPTNESQVKWADEQQQNQQKDKFVFKELSVPRRPAWDASTTAEELDYNERNSFLEWRRGIAAKEMELMKRQQRQHQQEASSSQAQQQQLSVTPFEKNLQVWRQLWRVLERCSCILQLADARNPMFYLSQDLKEYANELGKPMMVLINKSDYLSTGQRRQWQQYLQKAGWGEDVVFFSAVQEQQKLDRAAKEQRDREQQSKNRNIEWQENDNGNGDDEEEDEIDESDEASYDDGRDDNKKDDDSHQRTTNSNDTSNDKLEASSRTPKNNSRDNAEKKNGARESHGGNDNNNNENKNGVEVPLTREQLMESMMSFARRHSCRIDPRQQQHADRLAFGMVGFPNVGKSSVINVLMGSSKHTHGLTRVGVASQPGKTKHFQTLLLPDREDMMLCDCPGLVFPSFVSNTADLIAAGVYPISQMRNHWPVSELISQRIPRQVMSAVYGIQLPVPPEHEIMQQRLGDTIASSSTVATTKSDDKPQLLPQPTAEEFLTTLCYARGLLAASSGNPDCTRAARMVIKDYASGKLLYCHHPPDCTDTAEFYTETARTAVNNTKKLRENLLRQEQKQLAAKTMSKSMAADDNHGLTGIDTGADVHHDNVDDVVDEDLFDLIDDSLALSPQQYPEEEEQGTHKHHNKAGKKGKKWGKKGRKHRNKDPYGCHSTPDSDIFGQSQKGPRRSGGGLKVKGVKYGGEDYTRPAHAGARVGVQSVQKVTLA